MKKAGKKTTKAATTPCIWSIGQLLWQIMMLSYPPPKTPYTCKLIDPTGNSNLTRYLTFRKALESSNYSLTLKTLVLRCLIEHANGRPSVEELLGEIRAVLEDPRTPKGCDNFDYQPNVDPYVPPSSTASASTLPAPSPPPPPPSPPLRRGKRKRGPPR